MIYLEKRMKVLDKPFLISLPIDVEAPETQSYVAPDVVVSQDDDLLDIRPYRGAPKLVVEALSPDSRSRDLDKKHRIYEKRKVPEYWVVDPNNGNLFVFVRNKAGVYDQQSADDSGYTYSPICEQSLRIVPRGRSFQVLTRNPKKS
jgi:Uma2 family endonuclease